MLIPLLIGAVLGGLAGWWIRSRKRPSSGSGPVDPHFLPDPALRWLLRAHGALGIWTAEPGASDESTPAWRRVLGERGLTNSQLDSVQQRLQRSRSEVASGAERLDSGILLFGTTAGTTAGLLLPDEASRAALNAGNDDLILLLDALSRRPIVRAMEGDDHPVESVGSIGLRLAYQLERILNAEVIVAAADRGSVRVVGISGRADRRLLDTYAVPGSPMHQVAVGEVPSLTSIADPLGGAVVDRRARFTPAIVLPVKHGEDSVGAVAFWSADESEPVGPVIAEVREVIRNAGPRFKRALEHERLEEAVTTDPLTGIRNRRGLDEAMARIGSQRGAYIAADLDKFKLLNDTLGHPAGDAALVHFARIIHEEVRGSDTAARVGGEEFAVWLPGAVLGVGMRIAEQLRIKLGTTVWEWQGRSWPLSASFGVAATPETTRSRQNLPSQADAALYEAKRSGRNRVVVAKRASGPETIGPEDDRPQPEVQGA